MSINDDAWSRFFERTPTLEEIDAHGLCYVSADDLKSIAEREPRLMAKLDTRSVCPKVFRENSLAIFPVRNGQYILFRDPDDKSYFRFSAHEYEQKPEIYRSAVDLASFDSYPGSRLNESQALDFAHLTTLLHNFTGEHRLYLTIRGRTRSGRLGFKLPEINHDVTVEGVQIEVDAGYESNSAIYLIEAKVGRRADFHIRQLFYPYLDWSGKSNKRIVPIFLAYTNGKFYISRFEFDTGFGNLHVAERVCYVIDETPVAAVNLEQILADNPEANEPELPYPQANDLDKVIDLVSAVDKGFNDKAQIADFFEFDERQGDYYANAATYLGFIQRVGHEFSLTPLGKKLNETPSVQSRTRLLLEQMSKRPTLRRALFLLLARDFQLHGITNDEIANIVGQFTNLTGTTPRRRASTVRSWLAWLLDSAVFRD